MAQTQKFYRLGQRKPRQTTRLNAFANGMYLTKQTIPEGYVKAMVNYDIDDTGSHIKPRYGRKRIQGVEFPNSYTLSPATFTDYIYCYNEANTLVEDTLDTVFGLGGYTGNSSANSGWIPDVLKNDPNYKHMFISKIKTTTDSNVYELVDDEWVVVEQGDITENTTDSLWGVYYDKDKESFKKILNKNIGYVTARTIEHAYAFDKAVGFSYEDDQTYIEINNIGLPIYTILENEIYAFTGSEIDITKYEYNSERDEVSNFGSPVLSKLILTHEQNDYTLKRKVIEPQVLDVTEATKKGYNMLTSNPYMFRDMSGGVLSIIGLDIYKDRESNRPVFGPTVGNPVELRVYYQYPDNLSNPVKYKIEVLDLTTGTKNWQTLVNFDQSITAGQELWYTFTPISVNCSVRVTIRKGDDTSTEYPYSLDIECKYNPIDEAEIINFDLATCKGMFTWNGRVGVYGVNQADNTIFLSDVENPTYFPYPDCSITLDNKILYVHNYLDYLLVITVDSIWLLQGDGTTSGTYQKRILANIFIPEIDAVNTVILKDQIFFKTDSQFYVLKPNQYTSDATDLKNFVNSTAISNYTLDFTKETVALFNEVYRLTWQKMCADRLILDDSVRFVDFAVTNIKSQVRNEEVHYLYSVIPQLQNHKQTLSTGYEALALHLVYNTVSRSWRLYFRPFGDIAWIKYYPLIYRNKQSGVFYEFFCEWGTVNVIEQTYEKVTDDVPEINLLNSYYEYNNYPYIDTGTIAIEDINTKRFRELQLNLVNLEKETIRFYADFKLDGKEWIHATHYKMKHIWSPLEDDYGTVYITPVEYTNLDLYGTTTLADDITEADHWAIDLSKFPELTVATVRFTLQGRGRRGSLQLLNTSLKKYQLSDINWVYRTMSAR